MRMRRTIAAGDEAKIVLDRDADPLPFLTALDDGIAQYLDLECVLGDHAAALQKFKSLRGLRLLGDTTAMAIYLPPFGDRILEAIAGLRNLQSLELNALGVSDRGAALLAAMPSLEIISIGDMQMSDVGLAHLKKLPRLRSLTLRSSLRTGSFPGAGERPCLTGAAFVHLRGMPGLQALRITLNDFTDEGLAAAAGFEPLKEAWIGGAGVTDKGLAPFLRQTPGLEFLCLFRVSATEASLAPLAEMPKLRQLDLFDMRLSARGIEAIAGARTLESVTFWDVELEAKDLALLRALIHLRSVELRQCPGVGKADAESALKAAPKAKLHFSPASVPTPGTRLGEKPIS